MHSDSDVFPAASLCRRIPADGCSTVRGVQGRTMGEFDDQLQKAIQRGQMTRAAGAGAAADDAATEEQFRQKHAQLRNELSDYIETRLRTLCDHFPGFEFQTVVNEKGWGARIYRDDMRLGRGTARNEYSRLEILVRPFSDVFILEVTTKGTIRNRESLNRSKHEFLREATFESLRRSIDSTVLEFAEQYSAHA